MGKARQIELTKDNIRLIDPEFMDKDSRKIVEFYVECWFDEDKYFGAEVGEDTENCWINFYICYDMVSENITAFITVNGEYQLANIGATCDGDDITWELTPEEQKMFKEAITQFAVEGYGSLEKFIESFK